MTHSLFEEAKALESARRSGAVLAEEEALARNAAVYTQVALDYLQ